MSEIRNEKALRKIIGNAPEAIKVKKLEALEQHSQRYLEMSKLMAISAECLPQKIQLVATQKCQLEFINEKQFQFEINSTELNIAESVTAKCGLYILVAGLQESLRINGTLTLKHEKNKLLAVIEIEELYFHCAKSIMRSDFWTAGNNVATTAHNISPASLGSEEVTDFLDQATFLLLASQNSHGESDLSPRGDPPGFVKRIDDNKIFIPERPGNKIADSLVNILTKPSIAVMLFTPGLNQSLIFSGTGTLTSSESVLSASAINNKMPKLGIILDIEYCYYGFNPLLDDMDLWNPNQYIERSAFPSLGKILADQLQGANKVPGKKSAFGRVLGKAAGSIADAAIKNDYKRNLY